MENINIFVLILAFIFALGWLKEHISLLAMICYMQMKNCKEPSDQEIEACTKFVIDQMIKGFFRGKGA